MEEPLSFHDIPFPPTQRPPKRKEDSGLGFFLPLVPQSLSPGDCLPILQNWSFHISVSERSCWSRARTRAQRPKPTPVTLTQLLQGTHHPLDLGWWQSWPWVCLSLTPGSQAQKMWTQSFLSGPL